MSQTHLNILHLNFFLKLYKDVLNLLTVFSLDFVSTGKGLFQSGKRGPKAPFH